LLSSALVSVTPISGLLSFALVLGLLIYYSLRFGNIRCFNFVKLMYISRIYTPKDI
jgi:hypothetical protein